MNLLSFFRNRKQKSLSEKGRFKGIYTIRVVGPDGKVKQEIEIENDIPLCFREANCNRYASAVPSNALLCSHIAIGSSSTAFADSQTTLVAEEARAAVASRTYEDDVLAVATVFPAGAYVGTVREFAVFFDATGAADSGLMGSRALATVVLTALDALFVDWRLTLSDA